MIKKGNNTTTFYDILYNKILKNHHKNYPKKGVREIYPQNAVTENGKFSSMTGDDFSASNFLHMRSIFICLLPHSEDMLCRNYLYNPV